MNDDLIKQFEEAAKRLEVRGDAPPWVDHPLNLHMSLFVADELSTRIRGLFEVHLKECAPCREQTNLIRDRRHEAASQDEEKEQS